MNKIELGGGMKRSQMNLLPMCLKWIFTLLSDREQQLIVETHV
jgi:hypothetical protein